MARRSRIVPVEGRLWRAAKRAAEQAGTTLPAVIHDALLLYVKDARDRELAPPPPRTPDDKLLARTIERINRHP